MPMKTSDIQVTGSLWHPLDL